MSKLQLKICNFIMALISIGLSLIALAYSLKNESVISAVYISATLITISIRLAIDVVVHQIKEALKIKGVDSD